MQYDVIDVLQHYGISTRKVENDTVSVLCPFHDDTNPSGLVNVKTGRYSCWACNKHTTALEFLAKKYGQSIRDVYYTVGKLDSTPSKYKIEDPANIEEWHVNLFSQDRLMRELKKRAVTPELIRTHRLGAFVPGDGDPVVRIPIRNKRGEVIAFKDYNPGATTAKYLWPNCGVNRSNKRENRTSLLFPADQLAYPTILICGGELKAIVAAAQLNKHGIGAISGTGSENTAFEPTQLQAFRDKVVYVCYDVDEVGKENAEKLCRHLRNYADTIYNVALPLDVTVFPKGDINDYIYNGGDLYEVLKETKEWEYVPPKFDDLDENEEPKEVSLEKAVNASMAKQKVKIRTLVSSMDTSPYPIPKGVKLKCDRNHKYCQVCKIHEAFTTFEADVEVSQQRLEIMEMVGQDLTKQEKILKKTFGIPQRCSSVVFNPQTFHHVEDIRVSQHLDITSRTNERSMQAAYYIGEKRVELNEGYLMTGRMYPHPETQQATLLINELENVQDALSTYKPTKLDELRVFRPQEWTTESISEKLDEIYTDLSTNVTEIYGRQDLHLLYDLAYHSVLLLPRNLKGWVEVLVVGDSAQGKSVCATRLSMHYGLGERVVCKGATVAGLLGGLQQHGKRWFASWGKIPTHDRRLVILDEVKGTRPEVIAGLTDMRTSGIAELTKIEKRRTNARTRLIMISNPRSERVVREYNTGVDIVRELIGNPEDVRRLDAVMVVAQREVPQEVVHARNRPNVEHKYTADLCRELILFAWTVPNVEFEDSVYLSQRAIELTKEYVEDTPIVDSNSIHEKIMRLSTALAVRTFSIKDNETVFVRNCHVDYIIGFLNKLYSSPAFGYKDYSQKRMAAERMVRPDLIKREIHKTPFPDALVHALLTSDDFDYTLFSDILGWPPQDARSLLAFFNRHRAIKGSRKSYYRKTSAFTRLLKEMEDEMHAENQRIDDSKPLHLNNQLDEEF